MRNLTNRFFAASASLLIVASARAGLFEDFYRGLGVLTTPTGGPLSLTSDGTRINGERNGRLRVVPNRLGRGWDIELDRGFGLDSRGRPEVYDAGALELELRGSVQSTLSFTSRWFMTGTGDTTINNLQYAVRGKSGAQDVELTGVLNGAANMEINQFGFYTMRVDVQNTNSQLTVDGVAVRDTQNTDFDIGPINVQGNIFVDIFASVLSSMGIDTSEIQKFFPDSPFDRIGDEIAGLVRKAEFASSPMNSSLGDQSEFVEDAQKALMTKLFGFGPRSDAGSFAALTAVQPHADTGFSVPEPSALLLLGLGGLIVAARRRLR